VKGIGRKITVITVGVAAVEMAAVGTGKWQHENWPVRSS
jgi:hypothetical protein